MKILIINSFGIGDVLFTTPLVSNLRLAYPDAFIGYIANLRALPVLQNNPKINRVYVYDRDEFQKDFYRSWLKLFQEIRKEQFDAVFDFSLNPSFGFFALICGIKRRIGYDYRNRGRFLTDKIVLEGYEARHVVDYYLNLLKKLDLPTTSQSLEIYIGQDSHQWAQEWIKLKGIDLQKPLIAVIPGGGASWGKNANQKQWPVEQYASLVDKIVAKTKATIILMGDLKDQKLCQELTHQCAYPVYDAVGITSLHQMAALLKLCRFAIVNDGGPLHVAVAAQTKTVSIFGPVDPLVYGPYQGNQQAIEHLVIQNHVPCQPCYRQFRKANCDHLSCLNLLSANQVFNHIERLL